MMGGPTPSLFLTRAVQRKGKDHGLNQDLVDVLSLMANARRVSISETSEKTLGWVDLRSWSDRKERQGIMHRICCVPRVLDVVGNRIPVRREQVYGHAKGVSARIYTIDPDMWVPWRALSEHIVIALSYANGYWVQIGYRKTRGYGIDFYNGSDDSTALVPITL